MANTVSNISYANTFGDWVVATDALIRENNTLAKGNYTKDSGTLTLSESSLVALQSSGDIVAQKQLLVQGLGSSATIDNNLTVGKQVYFTNAVLGLTHTGQANMNGLIVAQGPNIGIFVANNAHVNGNTTIKYNTVTDKVQANTSVTTPLVSSTTVTNSGVVYTNQVRANTLASSVTINNTGRVYTDTVSSNTSVATPLVSSSIISNSDTVYTGILSANTNIISPLISSVILNNSDTINTNILTSNTLVSSVTVNASDKVLTNILTSNTLISSVTLNNSGTVYTDKLSANTNITSPLVSSVTLNNSGTVHTGILTANTSGSIPTLTVDTRIDGNSATAFFNTIYAANVQVSGSFTQVGETVYTSNTFVLSQNVSSAINSALNVDRGPGVTEASFRWTEIPKNWQINNVTTGTYYRVHTDEHFATVLSDASTTNIANAFLANTLNNTAQAAFARANSEIIGTSAYLRANAAFDRANSEIIGTAAYVQANTALATALAAKTIFTGTSGSPYTSNTLTFSSNNGVIFVPIGSNTFAVSTSQDLRTTATPSFATATLSTTPLGTSSGGTSKTSGKSAFEFLIAESAGTGTSGQVLTTGGAGSYYWAAGGGGGGSVQPGTTINSTSLSYSGDNIVTKYTSPTFTQTNQLRAYINGLRQFASEYTANSANSTIVFNIPPSTGDSILVEVDGYIINPYYANNVPLTPTGTITGNTIQLGIESLESSKAALIGAVFTGDVVGISHDANTSNTSFATTQYVKNVLNQLPTVSGVTYAISTSGNAGTVTSGVYTSGTQTIGGIKTFSSTIVGSINGNAATVTTIPNLTGDVTSVGNATTLASTGTNTGNFGSGTTVPIITVDSKGRITSVSSTLITGGSAGTGSTTYNRVTTTGTAGQTLISSIPHVTGYLQVFMNGVMLPANDFTSNASNSSIVITSPLRAGDIVESFAYTTTLANNLSPGTTGGSGGTVLYQSAANTTGNTIVGTSGYLLTSAGTGQPTWTNPATLTVSAATTFSSTTSNSQFFSIGVGTAASSVSGEIRATNNITAYYSSDRKFKENIQDIPNALDKVDAIGGKLFDWTDEYIQEHGGEDGYFVQKADFGVIAQDVKSVFPLATRTRIDGSLAVDYEKLCALAFAAIKELKIEVEVLKGQIK